jgi:hypothetical protein
LERSWVECLLYPFLNIGPIASVAVGLTVLTLLTAVVLPRMFAEPNGEVGPTIGSDIWSWLGVVAVVAVVYEFLSAVLASAAVGEAPTTYWPGYRPRASAKLAAIGIVCLLVGPVAPILGAYYYGLIRGEWDILDWIIVGELLAGAIGYGMLAFLAVLRSGRFAEANPWQVGELFFRLGPRVILVASLLAALGLALVRLGSNALDRFDAGILGVSIELAWWWFLYLFLSTFLVRLFGIWSFRLAPGASHRGMGHGPGVV